MKNQKLESLYRKRKTLQDNKKNVLKMLNPILVELEVLRIKIDEIELSNCPVCNKKKQIAKFNYMACSKKCYNEL